MSTSTHQVLRLFVRPARRETPEERETLTLKAGHGVEGDHGAGGKRQITILFEADWQEALAVLGEEVDPIARRANVLVSGGGADAFLGATLKLGEAEIRVRGAVKPCARMDEARAGLQDALSPGARAGIWGDVVKGGVIAALDGLSPLLPGAEAVPEEE